MKVRLFARWDLSTAPGEEVSFLIDYVRSSHIYAQVEAVFLYVELNLAIDLPPTVVPLSMLERPAFG